MSGNRGKVLLIETEGGKYMVLKVLLNKTQIDVINFHEKMVADKRMKKELHKVGFKFNVTSNAYHDITTLLYENDFEVNIPEKGLEFKATIYNYSTSITNLYKENEVGEFYLELIEKA